jgi:hypothetical protein
MMNEGGGIVGMGRIFNGKESANVIPFAAIPNVGGPLISGFIPVDADETARVVSLLPSVELILRTRAFSDVVAAVIQRVVVFVVRELSGLAGKNHSVHVLVVARADDVECSSVRIPQCVPVPLQKEFVVRSIDNGILFSGKWNNLVGWVKRLNNFVSADATFHKLTSHGLVTAAILA